MVDNGAAGDIYSKQDVARNSQGQNVLYAADIAQNHVEMFDGNFNAIGSFTDPTVTSIEPSFGAWSVQTVNNKLFVTFASLSNMHGGWQASVRAASKPGSVGALPESRKPLDLKATR